MKSLSQHIQENLNSESLKEVFTEKLVDEELDALTRVSPATTVDREQTEDIDDPVTKKENKKEDLEKTADV